MPGLWLTGFASAGQGRLGVFFTGHEDVLAEAMSRIGDDILAELPPGSDRSQSRTGVPYFVTNCESAGMSDDAQRRWISETLNVYANVLRPRLLDDSVPSSWRRRLFGV